MAGAAYTMPANATDVAVLRVVVREGFSADLARLLFDDIRTVLDYLSQDGVAIHSKAKHFAH